ncbi:hypothetical protein [Pseudomonas sp. IT-P218]
MIATLYWQASSSQAASKWIFGDDVGEVVAQKKRRTVSTKTVRLIFFRE